MYIHIQSGKEGLENKPIIKLSGIWKVDDKVMATMELGEANPFLYVFRSVPHEIRTNGFRSLFKSDDKDNKFQVVSRTVLDDGATVVNLKNSKYEGVLKIQDASMQLLLNPLPEAPKSSESKAAESKVGSMLNSMLNTTGKSADVKVQTPQAINVLAVKDITESERFIMLLEYQTLEMLRADKKKYSDAAAALSVVIDSNNAKLSELKAKLSTASNELDSYMKKNPNQTPPVTTVSVEVPKDLTSPNVSAMSSVTLKPKKKWWQLNF